MDFFNVVRTRRSIRQYSNTPVPPHVMEQAIDAALLAPNSSNLQTWQFYWVTAQSIKEKLVVACLNQAAARTAQELLVCVADPTLWKKTNPALIHFARQQKAPKKVLEYYERYIPAVYGLSFLGRCWRWLWIGVQGLSRPVQRRPFFLRDFEEVSLKSLALACENFMLAITAQGFDSCPMEGFDECRVKKILRLPSHSRVGMIISVGMADLQKGPWGPQVRFDRSWFVKKIES